MAIADLGRPAREHPIAATAAVSAVGYALVAAAFAGAIPLPRIDTGTVNLLADLIAVINTVALASILLGYRAIRRGEVRRHRAAMLSAFGLIMLFLVLYLVKVGGGFEKSIVIREGQFLAAHAGTVEAVYLAMLVVHVFLSVVSVPVVLYAVVLGLTHTPAELAGTAHPRVGRIAVAAWTLSLTLGVVTYFLLNHVYAWEAIRRSAVVLIGLRGIARR